MSYRIEVNGMSCRSCEEKVENKFKEIEHVTFARAYASKDYVIVETTKEIKQYKFSKALKELPYTCENVSLYQHSILGKVLNIFLLLIIVAVLILGRRYVPILDTQEGKFIGLSIVIVYGLLNSFHCMSMCGGLIVTRIMIVNKENTKREISLFVFGRIISYTAIGVLLGALGSVVSVNETFKGFVSLFAGVLMILLALQLLGYIRLPKIVKHRKSSKSRSSFMLGVMNGFLPCGSLQAMQLYALSTASVFYGGLVMLVFGVTTSLSLATFAGLANKIRLQNKKIKILSVVIILFLGYQFITQGVSQIQVSTSNEFELLELDENTEYQTLKVDVTGTYTFSKNEIKVGVPVKLEFGITNPDGCSNPFYIILPSGEKHKVDVLKDDSPITFLPTETGVLRIKCWMNMRTKSILIVD